MAGLSRLGDSMFRQETAGAWCMSGCIVGMKLPIAAAFWIIRMVSTEECLSLTQILMQIHSSACSVILNVTATQYTCSLSDVYHPHWLVQWSRHCSHMRVPVHSPWLPGHIDVTQTILITLTMAALFPDRPRMSSHQLLPLKWKCI